MNHLFRRYIALPQDHGSWVFLLSPLAIGLVAGKDFPPASLAIIFGAIAGFLLRQPISITVKIYAGRRSRSELPATRLWMLIYGLLGLMSLVELFYLGNGFILFLGIPAVAIFACHLYLIAKRSERGQMLVEILATGALALIAPAAYWAAIGSYNPTGWWLWLLSWLQSTASIVYVYLRLEQRVWISIPSLRDRFTAGWQALAIASFNLTLCLVCGILRQVPAFIFIPYLLQWFETLRGIFSPASGVKPVAIGIRQLIISTLFTILFITFWR